MNSKISLIKNKLRKYLKDKEILDIIIFGSAVKGKAIPEDIDIAVISDKEIKIELEGFHISMLKPEDFFNSPPTVVHTLFREGYSLKSGKPFSEIYGFLNRALFKYELVGLAPSLKVQIVNILRGKNKKCAGMVEENKGEWLANQVFIVPVENGHIFEQFFINFKVKFRKFYILMH